MTTFISTAPTHNAQFAFAAVNTDCATYALGSSSDAVTELQVRGDVTITEMTKAGQVIVESQAADPTVADLEAEYDLERLWEYLDRTAARARSDDQRASDGR